MGRQFKDIAGQQFGRLTAQWPAGINKGSTKWLCLCSCGTLHLAPISSMLGGYTHSCGCLKKELSTIRATKHGMSHSPEYDAWCGMQRRCFSPRCDQYMDYGGRGITVSPLWRGPGGFKQFFTEIGERPSNAHSLDRINNSGNYEPGNVKWSTKSEQNDNRRMKRLENFTNEEIIQEAHRRGLS